MEKKRHEGLKALLLVAVYMASLTAVLVGMNIGNYVAVLVGVLAMGVSGKLLEVICKD